MANKTNFTHLQHLNAQYPLTTAECYKHRYRVAISFFVLANSDGDALKYAQEVVALENSEHDNQCTLDCVDQIDFGSMKHERVYPSPQVGREFAAAADKVLTINRTPKK